VLEESVTKKPSPFTSFHYPSNMFADTQTTLDILVTLEDAFIAAYLVGVRHFSTADLRVTAARIMGIEPDHRTLARASPTGSCRSCRHCRARSANSTRSRADRPQPLEYLVAIGAVHAQHAIEVLAVHVHDSHQHVRRRERPRVALAGDANRVLGDPRDRIAIAGWRAGALAIGARRFTGERLLAHSERLQRDPDAAVQAQDSQPTLRLGLGRAGEGHRRGGDAKRDRRVRREHWSRAHSAAPTSARRACR
jgi:hypothetical protein